MPDVSDLSATIVPKSDQLNAEQLLAHDMTITVTDVRMGASDEQPVAIHYEHDEGRPFKPCKTMRKLLIFAWGEDGRAWVGRSMTLYNDPEVRFGGATVGGIRISHLSHIERDIAVSLTATKGKKVLHTVGVLRVATLAGVLEAIAAASNKAGMERAKAMAQQLKVPADVERAREAYAQKVRELQARAKGYAATEAPGEAPGDAPPPPTAADQGASSAPSASDTAGPSAEQLLQALDRAPDRDVAAEVLDRARHLPQAERRRLEQRFDERFPD